MHSILISILACFLFSNASANEVVTPSDMDYFVYQKNGIHLVAPEEYSPYLPQTFEYMNEFVRRYEKSFNWKLDEKIYLVLASPNNQIANGFATVTPNLMTVFYPSGALELDDFALYSWFLALSSHETAHLFQLNSKGKSDSLNNLLYPYVKNSPLNVGPFGIPVFIHPNILLPRFILEGNAVMNESRLARGGRLQSAKVRAVVYSLLKGDKVDFKYLLNEHLEFPFGNEKYWLGGYLQAYLAEKYGIEKTNRFFFSHGDSWLNPLLLRDSFLGHFGESYAQALTGTLMRFRPEAKKQQSSNEAVISKGVMFGPMNHTPEQIFFLKSDQLEERPKLIVYNNFTGQLTETPIDLAMGKVFKMNNNEWASAAAVPYKATKRAYGLYGEGLKVYRDYLNKMMVDQRAGHTLTFDPTRSLLRNKLYLDGRFWGETDSIPHLDESGHVYDFVQDGPKRILRRDQKPLVSFNAYDGTVVDATEDGKVYFTSTSPYGSTLYLWNGKEIQRLSDSDAIVDAEVIDDKKALAIESTPTGYQLKVIPLKPFKDIPQSYTYKFKDEPLNFESEKNHDQKLAEDAKDIEASKRGYNGLFENLRWSRLTFFTPSIIAGIGSLQAELVDPLHYHKIGLGYSHDLDNSHNGLISYSYDRHLVNLSLLAAYQEPIYVNSKGKVTDHQHERILGVGLDSDPFLIWRRWKASAGTTAFYENEDVIEKKTLVTSAQLNYSRSYARSYNPDRYFNLLYKNRVSSELKSWKKDDGGNLGQISTVLNLGSQTFLNQSVNVASAEQSSIRLRTLGSLTGQDLEVQRLYDRSLISSKVAAYRLGLLKAFHTPIYTTRFPIGLRRVAPFFESQMLWLYTRRIFEYQLGIQLESLLFQSFPLRVGVSVARDDMYRDFSLQIQAGFQQNF